MGSMSKEMWQPIETAPKDGTELIGWNGREVTAIAWIDHPDDEGDNGWCDSRFVSGGLLYVYNNIMRPPPTHWMPLPEAPE